MGDETACGGRLLTPRGCAMPLMTFDIETYTVLSSQSGTTSGGSWRVITLSSTALAHGIRSHASIYFFEAPGSTGVVTNVDQPNANGLTAYAYGRKEDFTVWYDMLRNESPMKFACAFEGAQFDPSRPSRPIYWFQLFTGQEEPPGEGPEASTALRVLALALEADAAES